MEKAEEVRREFTANVSHELRTPLQTIAGSSELLSNGMVAADDVPKFASRINKEAKRLIALVEDIIKLSHLDEESSGIVSEKIDLLDAPPIQQELYSPFYESYVSVREIFSKKNW